MLRSAAASACCTVHTMVPQPKSPHHPAGSELAMIWIFKVLHSRERNPWSFNATTRYWVNSSKFWKPIICRFVLWVLILFQWLLDAKISGGVSLLYNTILLVRASVIWCNTILLVRTSVIWRLQVFELGPSSKMGLIPHAHLPSLVMLIFFLPFSWDSSLIAHLHLHLYLHLHLHRSLFLHHYSYNTVCSRVTVGTMYGIFHTWYRQ